MIVLKTGFNFTLRLSQISLFKNDVKMDRINRNKNTAAAETSKSKFTVPTSAIDDVHFTHRNIKLGA